MYFSEKLMELRRSRGMSQEQLADRCGVTRQSVSKWESGTAMPELSKLIALSALFGVSVDYLVKDGVELDTPAETGLTGEAVARLEKKMDDLAHWGRIYRYTSSARIFGIPLVSIRFGRQRHPSRDTMAVGILAIGNCAVGVLPIGLICVGVVPIGLISIGGVALGMIAIGGLAFGGVAVGYLAVGASALGMYAIGAAAMGYHAAIGAAANATAAVGVNAEGIRTLLVDSATTSVQVLEFLKPELAKLWAPIHGLVSIFIKWIF